MVKMAELQVVKQPVKRSFSTVAQEELICPLCYELFRGLCEPKELDCAHVFCQICLLRMVGVTSLIVCPECRQTTNVPSGGVSSMKCVFRLRNLAEKFAIHCSDLSLRKTSTPHMTSSHKSDVANCTRHKDEKMYFMCLTCNVPICQFCLVRNHTPPAHEIQEIQTSREELQNDLENAIDQAETARTKIEDRAKMLTDQVAETVNGLENEFSEIDRHVEEIVEIVRESGESLKNDVRRMAESRLSCFNHERDYLEERAQTINMTQAKARNTRANLPDQVYTTRYKPVVKKLQMLCSDASPDIQLNPRIPKFVPDPLPSQLAIAIGRIEMPVTAQAVSEFGNFQFARGIAAIPSGEGFAVTDFYGTQSVFFRDNGSYKQQVFLDRKEGKYRPTDVTVTTEGDYLLASWIGLEMYSPTGVYKSAFSDDTTSLSEGIYSITSTTDNRILVGNIEQSSITVYNNEGALMKTVKVALKPYKIATNDTHVAICQEVSNTIAVVSLDSAEELFRVSIDGVNGICYENTSNSLLVGKSNGRRSVSEDSGGDDTIEQYCATTGRWINRVATGLYSPQAMALTEEGTLAVADRKSVKVFQMN